MREHNVDHDVDVDDMSWLLKVLKVTPDNRPYKFRFLNIDGI
jgi:hypothetical protein